jgi:hypothetical protein
MKDVCRRAQAALAASSAPALRRLRVEVADDALLLRGLVASFYHKQLAQEIIRRIVGEFRLVNAVAVQ